MDVRSRRSISLTVLGVFAALIPLACASPVDPTWFAGLYDNGDSDEAVLQVLATSESAAPAERVVIDVAHHEAVLAVLAKVSGRAVVIAAPSDLTRAPPSS